MCHLQRSYHTDLSPLSEHTRSFHEPYAFASSVPPNLPFLTSGLTKAYNYILQDWAVEPSLPTLTELMALPLVLPQRLVPVSGMPLLVLNFNFSSHFCFSCQAWAWRRIISHLFLYLEHVAHLLAHSRNSGDVWPMNALKRNLLQMIGKDQVAAFG